MSQTATQSLVASIVANPVLSGGWEDHSTILLSAEGDGHWVTMEGEHVFIRGGVIAKGPAKLVGKKPSDLPDRSQPHKKISDHESSYHGAVAAHEAAKGNHHPLFSGKAEPATKQSSLFGSEHAKAGAEAAGRAATAIVPAAKPISIPSKVVNDPHEHLKEIEKTTGIPRGGVSVSTGSIKPGDTSARVYANVKNEHLDKVPSHWVEADEKPMMPGSTFYRTPELDALGDRANAEAARKIAEKNKRVGMVSTPPALEGASAANRAAGINPHQSMFGTPLPVGKHEGLFGENALKPKPAEAAPVDEGKIAGSKSALDPKHTAPLPFGAGKEAATAKRPETYLNGDRGEYVGTSEQIHGGTFHHVEMMEGKDKGKIKVTARAPDGSNPIQDGNAAKARETQKDMAEGMKGLNKDPAWRKLQGLKPLDSPSAQGTAAANAAAKPKLSDLTPEQSNANALANHRAAAAKMTTPKLKQALQNHIKFNPGDHDAPNAIAIREELTKRGVKIGEGMGPGEAGKAAADSIAGDVSAVASPAAQPTNGGVGSVYKGQFRGEPKWFVQEGDKPAFADAMHGTEEEATKHASIIKQRHGERTASRQAEQAKADKDAADKSTRESKVNAYLDKSSESAINKGKIKTTLMTPEARRSGGKIYSGTRAEVAESMAGDGFKPKAVQTEAVKDPSRRTMNRMDAADQADLEKRKAKAGTKTEHRMEHDDGRYFVVTKAEHDYAKSLDGH